MENSPNDRKSILMMVSSMLIFGTIGIFRKYIPVPSAFLAFFRGILGGLCILAYIRLRKKKTGAGIPFRTVLWLAVTGALIGINWMLLFEAFNHTTVAVATLCYYMEPTIVMLLSPVFFKEKLTCKKGICAVAAIIGMVLVSGVIGDACQKTAVQLLSAGTVMIPYLLLTNGFRGEGFSTTAVILLVIVGIVHTGIAYVLYFGSMDGLRVQTVAILGYIDPVSALLFSALLLREPLSLPNIIGAVMIIGSAVICEIPKTGKTE